MGYTHYWYRRANIKTERFNLLLEDFENCSKMFTFPLAGPLGEGEPILTQDMIAFNGVMNCGHKKKLYGIAWPAENAMGIASGDKNVAVGEWFGGSLLASRSCTGDCSHEAFHFPRVLTNKHQLQLECNGKFFDCCKTAYKPYDLAVMVALLIAKHRLGDDIVVKSDGSLLHWEEVTDFVDLTLGYRVPPSEVLEQ